MSGSTFKYIVVFDPSPYIDVTPFRSDGADIDLMYLFRGVNSAHLAWPNVYWVGRIWRLIGEIEIFRYFVIFDSHIELRQCTPDRGFACISPRDFDYGCMIIGPPKINAFKRNVSAQFLLGRASRMGKRVFCGSCGVPGFVGGNLDFSEGEINQDHAGQSDSSLNDGDPEHAFRPPSGVGGAISGLVCVLLTLGGLVVAVLGLKRAGDALGVAFERGGAAWVRVVGWGFAAWVACGLSAYSWVWWLGGARLP
jgi:hypothetical protein